MKATISAWQSAAYVLFYSVCNLFSRPIDGFYYPDLHFMHEEFEDPRAPWNDTVAGFLGFGYVSLELEVRHYCYCTHRLCFYCTADMFCSVNTE